MKKKTSNQVLISIIFLLCISVILSLCGCGAPTLEQYINNNKEKKDIMSEELGKSNAILAKSGMQATIDIDKNTLIYTYTMNKTFNREEVNVAQEYLEQFTSVLAKGIYTLAKKLEKEVEIEGITFCFIFVDQNNTEIYRKDFKPKSND